MKKNYFLKIAFCFLLISNISYGQLVTTIDFETVDSFEPINADQATAKEKILELIKTYNVNNVLIDAFSLKQLKQIKTN